MRIKKIITAILLLATCLTVTSCDQTHINYGAYEAGDLIYSIYKPKTENAIAAVYRLSETGRNKEVIYIPDEVDGIPVAYTGKSSPIIGPRANFYSNNMKKIYFPWSIEDVADSHRLGSEVTDEVYVICPSTKRFIDEGDTQNMYVINRYSYDVGVIYLTTVSGVENVIPANISYFFNYPDNPNHGYFFIDLLEDSGKLTKPPYDPKREGYTFDGWYKEPQCINKWDFENDTVIINFDEEGNRIYEEICLYAKWIEN